jgi:hypothetical protein
MMGCAVNGEREVRRVDKSSGRDLLERWERPVERVHYVEMVVKE